VSASLYVQDRPGGRPTPWTPGLICGLDCTHSSGRSAGEWGIPGEVDVVLKRAYEPATESDGHRVLVDRLWPRGVSRDRVRLDGVGARTGSERGAAVVVRA
jgi:hypothetical protein